MQDQGFSLAEIIGFLRRRLLMMIIIGGLVAVVAFPLVFVVPAKYRSTATILVEEQDIPRELVRSTVTTYADERIQVIGQRVMTRATLQPIVEKFALYRKERERLASEEVLDRMRKDIRVETVSASGERGKTTIAFRLSFDSTEPAKAQQVANELVSLYLNENARTRQERAGDTQVFLSDEAERVGRDIAVTEAKLAEFKRENAGRLPELLPINTQLRDRAENELEELDRHIRQIEDRRIYLESQLAVMKEAAPSAPVTGDAASDPKTRLRLLRNQYVSQSSVYGESHPDLVRMRKEIAALEASTGTTGSDFDAERLEQARAELKRLLERYSPDHPDVQRQQKVVAALEATRDEPKPAVQDVASNPAYMSIVTQIEMGKQEAAGMKARMGEVRGRLASLNSRIQQTPAVEQAYRDLLRDHENAVTKYQELRSKQMEAKVALQLEMDRKGERFSLIEPPQYPSRPTEPNRKKLLAMAMLGSVGGGFSAGYLAEMLNRSVTSPRALSALLEAPLLGVVPKVENAAERARRRRLIVYALIGIAVLVAAALLVIHFLYIPLDTLWFVLLGRLGL
jgi:polysaccharide biosynthesis transport protein